jgi:allantoate deiminase
LKDAATTAMQRCDRLADISEEDGVLVRPYGSQAMRETNDVVSGWLGMAGMTTRRDGIGNLFGRYEGTGEKTLILGSHLDTVRDAGKYDGILGVMVALACVQELRDRGERLPFSIEVATFADEEGLRFSTTFLGSSVYAGAFDDSRLSLEDRDGVTLREAVRDFGGDPDALASDGRGNGDLIGYCEVHIEQGPVLEREDLPVGVVTAINGQSRVRAGFFGKAGHGADGRETGCAVRRRRVRARGRGNGERGAGGGRDRRRDLRLSRVDPGLSASLEKAIETSARGGCRAAPATTRRRWPRSPQWPCSSCVARRA